jgi:tetrahydromethanopterin S-methyltransferase subunit D
VLARVLLVALAAVAVVVGVHALRADHRCAEAKAAAASATPGASAAALAAGAGLCGDPRDRALISLYLLRHQQRGAALDVARGMTRATPDDYLGWLVVWRLSGDRRALARAQVFNPRGTPRS